MTRFPCTNPDHDHVDPEDGPMVCADCGEPMHYDTAVEWYVHDRFAASCFLIQSRPEGASACDHKRYEKVAR